MARSTRKSASAAPAPDSEIEDEADAAGEPEATVAVDDPEVPVEEVVEDEDDADEDEAVVAVDEVEAVEDDEVEVEKAPAARPARPSPGRPPGAKEEPDPPFYIGERIRLVDNLRPRTGVPIGDHRIGAEGRVETVLSLTCIIRFDAAPDTKEVVAFTCIDSIDADAIARRAERDRLKKAAEKAG